MFSFYFHLRYIQFTCNVWCSKSETVKMRQRKIPNKIPKKYEGKVSSNVKSLHCKGNGIFQALTLAQYYVHCCITSIWHVFFSRKGLVYDSTKSIWHSFFFFCSFTFWSENFTQKSILFHSFDYAFSPDFNFHIFQWSLFFVSFPFVWFFVTNVELDRFNCIIK